VGPDQGDQQAPVEAAQEPTSEESFPAQESAATAQPEALDTSNESAEVEEPPQNLPSLETEAPVPTEAPLSAQPDQISDRASESESIPIVTPTELATTAASHFVRQRMFELQVQNQRPTQQHLWERSLGEYLLASAASRAPKQPRELDEEARDELCVIYLEMAKVLRDAGWLEQSCTALSTALLYNDQHETVLDDLEETVLEWVEFLEGEDCYQQAVMLLEGQWERRPNDKVRAKARAVFGAWAASLRQEGDHYGAEALEAYGASRMQYWEQLRAEWSTRSARPQSPDWE
jgi:hypothetical protein